MDEIEIRNRTSIYDKYTWISEQSQSRDFLGCKYHQIKLPGKAEAVVLRGTLDDPALLKD